MNLPTKITMVRLLLIPFFVAAYLIEFPYHIFVATGIFIVASLTDWLDGYIARKYKMVTVLGNFFDTVADKVLVACALILAVFASIKFKDPLTVVVIVCSIVIIAREFLIMCLKTIAATKNQIVVADKLGKLKMATELVALCFYLSYPDFIVLNATLGTIISIIGVSLLVISTLLAIVSAINYLVKNKSVLREDKSE